MLSQQIILKAYHTGTPSCTKHNNTTASFHRGHTAIVILG
jgi:hypothetical protein